MGEIWKKALAWGQERQGGVFSRTFPGAKKEEEEVPSSFFGSQDIRPPFPASFLLPLLFPFLRSRGIFPPPRALPAYDVRNCGAKNADYAIVASNTEQGQTYCLSLE